MKYGEMAFRTGEGIISTTAWTGDVSCVGYGAILKQLRESGYNKTSVTEEVIPVVPLLNTVPLYAGTVRAICDCGDHAWGVIADCDSELKCLQYRDELFRAGFTSVTERSICGNRFLKVRGFGCDVRLQYFPSDESMRILVSGTEPDVQRGKGDGDKFDSVTAVQIGLGVDITSRPISRDTASVSMSYVIRLSDGSFIVYDGGLKLKEYAERLLRTLNRLTPDGKPRIAAWILTHPHPDHTGVLEYFAENPEYRDAVDVELFISNFPSDIQVAGESEDLPAYQNAVKKCMDFFPSAKKIKPFTGDILFIHGVELEVLYSQEVFLPTMPDSVWVVVLALAIPSIQKHGILSMLAGAVCVMLPQLALAVIPPHRTLGGADIKLSGALAVLLGFTGGLTAFLAGLLMAVVTVTARDFVQTRLHKRRDCPKKPFALIPFLAVGGMVMFLMG